MSVLLLERIGATALLTMNRPDQRNALDLELRDAFAAAVAEVRDDPSVQARSCSPARAAISVRAATSRRMSPARASATSSKAASASARSIAGSMSWWTWKSR